MYTRIMTSVPTVSGPLQLGYVRECGRDDGSLDDQVEIFGVAVNLIAVFIDLISTRLLVVCSSSFFGGRPVVKRPCYRTASRSLVD